MSIFYRSLRVGKNGDTFYLLKFRTMKVDGGTPTAASDDPRLTKIGKFLRKTKLDELPTLINVLKRDINIVGPRPDVPSEINSLGLQVRNKILSVKPGLLSPATLWDFNEDEYLKGKESPHEVYLREIKPTKYKLNEWYVENRTLILDLKIIFAAIKKFLGLNVDVWKELGIKL